MRPEQLPPAVAQPLREAELAALPLSARERALLASARDRADVTLVVPTQTRVDVGAWLRQAPLWAACTRDELVLFAAGTRPCVERTSFADLGDSTYNPMTGAVVLAPAEGLQTRELRLPPMEGAQLLAQVLGTTANPE